MGWISSLVALFSSSQASESWSHTPANKMANELIGACEHESKENTHVKNDTSQAKVGKKREEVREVSISLHDTATTRPK